MVPRPITGSAAPVTKGGAPTPVRYAWEPKQAPAPQDWLSAAIGMPTSMPETNPWTPQKSLIETPTKLPEAPKGPENDDTTPPKDLNTNLPPRRGYPRLVPTPQNAHAQGPFRSSKISAPRKDSLSASRKATTPTASEARRTSNFIPDKADDSCLESSNVTPYRRQQREPSTVNAAEAPARLAERLDPAARAAEPAIREPSTRIERPQPAADYEPAEAARARLLAPAAASREPLRELGVTSPRCCREMALCSMEELPASLRHSLMFVRNVPALPCTAPGSCRPLLPPQRPEMIGRPTLVLDLDETLVHCSRSSSSRAGPPAANPDLIVQFDDCERREGVAFRPYVHHFLEAASKVFEMVVFTASQQSYADKVCNALDPEGTMIEHRLYRQHCTEYRGAFFKELSLMGRPLAQCILIDNSPISCACNADNSVLIKSWYGDQMDKELIDLLSVFKKMRHYGNGDCGRYLACRYGLRELFEGLRETAGHPRHQQVASTPGPIAAR